MVTKRVLFLVAVVPALALPGGCNSKARAAEKQYEIVSANGGSADDRCAAARAVQAGYLAAEDQEGYKTWRLRADIDCMDAKLSAAADAVTSGR